MQMHYIGTHDRSHRCRKPPKSSKFPPRSPSGAKPRFLPPSARCWHWANGTAWCFEGLPTERSSWPRKRRTSGLTPSSEIFCAFSRRTWRRTRRGRGGGREQKSENKGGPFYGHPLFLEEGEALSAAGERAGAKDQKG